MSLIPLRRNKQEWDHDNHPYSFDNPNIYMRPATEDDVDNMYAWEMESIDKSLQEDPKVQQLIRDDCYQSIKDTQMIMDQDKTIGMFTACMIDNGEWRYIGEIYLLPEYRGQHIGSTILKNEIANYDRIRLQVAFDNATALRLYESLGFKIVSSNKKGGLYIMEYDKNSQDSSIKKVTLDDEYKTLYFGSKNEIDDDSIQLQNDELFVTPFITLASIFAVRPRGKDINLPRGSYNIGYDEWKKPIEELSQETEPLNEVHVIIEGLPDLKPFDYDSSGFIYVIDAEDVKDHLYQKDWMDDQREYIIKDLESVPIQKVIPVDAVCHIRGGDKMAEPVTEAFFKEAYLKAKDRNALDDSDFALVYKDDRSGKTIRKYPIHDEAHVKAAAKMFPRGVPDEYKEKVAKKILRAAHSYDIDTSGWNSVNKAAKNKESHMNEYVSTILEYVSSKQRNREKKFLKERNFVPDKDNPNKGWIDSDFKDKNGKPKRIRFEINPHQGAALHYSTEKPVDFDNATISMSKNELRSKPQNAQQAFKHEEGHLFFFMNYNEWAKKNPIGENESKEDHMKRYMKTGEFKAFFDKVEKAVEDYADKLKGNEHGKKLDEYFADIFGIVNSLDKDLGLNLKSIRTLVDSKPSLKDKYKKRIKELEKNAIDLISKEFNEENFYGAHGFNIGPAKDDPRVQEIADLISDIRMDRMMIDLCVYDANREREKLKLAEEQNVNDSGKKWIESSIRIYEDHAKEKRKKINETKQKIKDLKHDLKTSLSIKYDCKGIEAYKKAYKQKVHEVIQMAEAEVELRFKLAKELSGEMKSKLKQEAAVSGGAYTSKGINWANVQPVTMVYKRFSTKNREQMEPIKRFWEISDKYFPEPSMTSGFGWDWTGWETDFAYGIIINDKKVPPEFMEELKQEFPDIILDENFLIPINYEEVYECSFEEMDATYDKIWSKGFLECEYEQYPALGRMKISVIYKKDADKLNSDISKYIKTVPTVKGYRFTLQDKNVGIYEELKRIMYNETNSPDTWEEFKKSPACSWLPSPPSYGENNKSYFTKLGYDKFMSDTWPVLTKYINDDTIDCDEVDIPVSEIVYQDDYQFITGSPLEESNTERKNLIMKEQVTKILEAYNSGVLTQEEAVEKIVQEDAITQKLKDMANNWDEDYYQKYKKSVDDDYKNIKYGSDGKPENPKQYEDWLKRHNFCGNLRALRPKYLEFRNAKEHDDFYNSLHHDPKRVKEMEEFSDAHKRNYADRVTKLANDELGIKESAIMNNLRAKQEKIMESYKMGIINGTEGMRLIERVLMEADFITEEEDTAYEGDDASTDDTPDVPDVDGDDSSDDSNIESLADYINSLDASERADLLAKINTDVATAGDADSSDDIENTDDTTADDLTPPDGETEEPTADGDTDAEPEVETESAKAIKEPDERLINAYKNVSLDDMEV